MKLNDILCTWDQAGEKPYLVLKKLGMYDQFLNHLSRSWIDMFDPIYRGTGRHSELIPGDILNYTSYPTSWSLNEKISTYFIEEIPNFVILRLITHGPLNGIHNISNTFDEDEFILAPQLLKVTQREMLDDYVRLTVEPYHTSSPLSIPSLSLTPSLLPSPSLPSSLLPSPSLPSPSLPSPSLPSPFLTPSIQNNEFNFYKKVECDEDQTICLITYFNIDEYSWNRIKRNSLTLAHAGIGPRIYNITENPNTITYQYINMFVWPIRHQTLTNTQLKEQAIQMVDVMHNKLNICHGDLAYTNVGYIGEKLFFIDHDELFNISEGITAVALQPPEEQRSEISDRKITPWVSYLLEMCECTFQQMIDSDYSRFNSW